MKMSVSPSAAGRQRSATFLSTIGRHLSPIDVTPCSSEVTSHYAEVNGVRLHYQKAGSGDHAVLLLPGALGCGRTDFRPQLEKLSKVKYTIIAFDPRGYGGSIPPHRDWPLLFMHRDAEDAAALMKSLTPHPFSVLGWSDGGVTGIVLAARYPGLVRRLVIWGANAYSLYSDKDVLAGIDDVTRWSSRMRQPFVEVYGLDYLQRLMTGWVKATGQFLLQRRGDLCMEEVKRVQCPSLIVHGQKDPLVMQEHPDYLHANIQGSVLVNWPEGKHNIHLRYVDDFNRLAENFLDQD